MYLDHNRGAEDQRKAALYVTLAHSHDQNPNSISQLGAFFLSGFGGLSKLLYRAKHYLEEAYYCIAGTLLELRKLQYEGTKRIPGHCCIPRVLFWARKVW